MENDASQKTDRQRLWLFTELYYPEDTSTGYYMTGIGEGLATDFEVNVICGQPNYSKRGAKAPKAETHEQVRIFRVSGTRLDKNVIVFKLVNMLTLGVSTFFAALRRLRPRDKVLVVTTPALLPFIAATAALLKGAHYVLLIHDNYPEILFATGKSHPGSLLDRGLSFANRWLYKHSTTIIVVGRDMRELVEQKTAGLNIPIATIPNWAELESVEPHDRAENSLLTELGLKGKFVLLYAGNMGYPNDMESILKAANRLREDENIHFIFLGTGVKRAWLEREVKSSGLRNVTVLDPRPRSDQNNFLNACDVGIVSLVSKMKGVSMPSRTYNLLAAGKPILAIAEPGSEIAMVTEEDNVGRVVAPGDVDRLTAAIEDLAHLGVDELSAMGERARRSALSKYSVNTALESYRRELT